MWTENHKEGGHIRNILDHIEDFHNEPCEDPWQVAAAVSATGTAMPGAFDLDAPYIPRPKPRYTPPVSHAGSTEQASRTTQKEKRLVLEALNNPGFEWRTIPGIVEETGLDRATVAKALSEFNGEVVKSSRFTADGRALYTTRKRYRESEPHWRKFLGAIKNRVD
jgi:hypothetical protein